MQRKRRIILLWIWFVVLSLGYFSVRGDNEDSKRVRDFIWIGEHLKVEQPSRKCEGLVYGDLFIAEKSFVFEQYLRYDQKFLARGGYSAVQNIGNSVCCIASDSPEVQIFPRALIRDDGCFQMTLLPVNTQRDRKHCGLTVLKASNNYCEPRDIGRDAFFCHLARFQQCVNTVEYLNELMTDRRAHLCYRNIFSGMQFEIVHKRSKRVDVVKFQSGVSHYYSVVQKRNFISYRRMWQNLAVDVMRNNLPVCTYDDAVASTNRYDGSSKRW